MLTTRKMSDRHEEDLVAVLGGTRTRNSGAVWSDQSDGHQTGLDQHWTFSWDGKALGVDAQVLTPSGYIKMGDIRVGDSVLDAHSGVTEVLGVYPQGVKPMHRITFSDGTSVEASGDHLWGLKQRTCGPRPGGGSMVVVKDRVWTTDRLILLPETTLRSCWLPNSGVAQFSGALQDEWVSPYVLGALLGDGKIGAGSCVLTSADPEIVSRVEAEIALGFEMVKFADRGTVAQYRIKGRDSQGRLFREALAESGVSMVNSHMKAIPDPYLWAGEEDRWALLQGLLDTDGWAEKGAGRFLSTSLVLRDQVAWLARSLGLRVNTYERAEPSYRNDAGDRVICRPAYQASIGYHPALFYLSRKAERLRPPTRIFHRTFWEIEEVEPKEAQCITVAASDGLFLVEDFIPTHNSTLGKSIGVSRAMWEKLREQCRGLEPLLPLRFYRDARLTQVDIDLVALDLETFSQILEDANRFREVKAWVEENQYHDGGFADAVNVVEDIVRGED